MADELRAEGVHLVGTIPLQNSEEVFRTVTSLLGDRLTRIPDGETGARKDWVWIQVPLLARHPDIVQTPVSVPGQGEWMLASLREGLPPEQLDLGNIGYADFAAESYATFRRLKDEGVIPEGVRFQVNLPTAVAIATVTSRPDASADIEAAYERALLEELRRITELVPHDELALQWDTCLELVMIEGASPVQPWFEDVWGGVRERMRRLGGAVPSGVDLGFHLCYGDYQHQRMADLDDASVLVSLANTLAADMPRSIEFLHLPVRGDVDPGSYLAPLDGLRLSSDTELYLGLITDEGGLPGAQDRITAARKHVDRFGVSTECGLGRRPPENIFPLLEIHRDVAGPVASAVSRRPSSGN